MSDRTDATDSRSIFLHVCCGPCAEWPVRVLQEEGYNLTAFYYNPNIHPLYEHDRRRENARKLMEFRNVPFLQDDTYMEDEWRAHAWIGKYSSHCEMCYDVRMRKTAEEAARRGFPAFSTTLLVSPYQDHEGILSAAKKAAAEFGVEFFYRDFRPGYREGQNMAREDGLYRQKYCGCILSLDESKFRDKIYKDFEGS